MALARSEWRYRQLEQSFGQYRGNDLVNYSVAIKVEDAPELGPFVFGGMYDPLMHEYVGEAPEPAVTWSVGKGQLYPFEFVTERRGDRLVIVGAKGAGKTEVLPRVAILYGLGLFNAKVGMLAPTHPRLAILREKFSKLLHPSWILESRIDDNYIMLVNRVKFEFVGMKQQSIMMGSPTQGRDWCAAFPDEEQNAADSVITDVEARGRSAPVDEEGKPYYPVISTCTISDDPTFRTRLARYRSEPDIEVYRMEAFANPFVPREHWERLQKRMTPREYAQEVLAMEQAPVRATYPLFDRKHHVRALPEVGYKDITRRVVGADMLIGYDPGEMFDVAIMLRCFQGGNQKRIWYVVDELTLERSTTDQFAAALLQRLQTKWEMQFTTPDGRLEPESGFVTIRADPHGNTETRPDVTVYRTLQQYGFHVKPAIYRSSKDPAVASQPGTLQKNARIETINCLLRNAAGETRLYIMADENKRTCAVQLSTALEMDQRDEYGKAEMHKKDTHDLSHWPAALGYALYPYEHVKLSTVYSEANHG